MSEETEEPTSEPQDLPPLRIKLSRRTLCYASDHLVVSQDRDKRAFGFGIRQRLGQPQDLPPLRIKLSRRTLRYASDHLVVSQDRDERASGFGIRQRLGQPHDEDATEEP